jgi:hypothetical protein
MAIQLLKAERRKAKLRLALTGPSGSGKTYSALRLASGLGEKIALIDTESGRASLYANDFNFDVAELKAPYTPAKYVEYIKYIESQGYDVLIIDSLTHAWAAEGGVLDMVNNKAMSSRSGNSFTAWKDVTPEQNKLIEAILQSKMNVIITMRSKVEYIIEVNEKGRSAPRKIGMAPIQREGLEYEFTIVFDLSVSKNIASVSKDNTKLFNGKDFQITEETGKEIKEWLNTGADNSEKVSELKKLIQTTATDEESCNKVKAYYNVTSWEEMSNGMLQSCIDKLKKKLDAPNEDESKLPEVISLAEIGPGDSYSHKEGHYV